ncbi:MAG: hypothetical protein ACRENP_04695 [Longimicrobiales bacterium]
MVGSLIVYLGLIVSLAGCGFMLRPAKRLRLLTRKHGLVVAVVGVLLTATGLMLPARESRVERAATRLDEFAPRWQFREFHATRIVAPPERVFDAIKKVRADEILLFRTLTWLRRFGRPLPESILNAGINSPLIEVATRSGFVTLAEDAAREVVIGTMVVRPAEARRMLTPQAFKAVPPGFAAATMNFLVVPDGPDASLVSTETRVFASGKGARRVFAGYWRFIYPGSAMIRRMWLRAIRRRALVEMSAPTHQGSDQSAATFVR